MSTSEPVERTGGSASGGGLRPRPRPRVHSELVDRLRERPVTTVDALRRAGSTLRLVTATDRAAG